MISFIYKTLSSMGFNHPLHPAMTHLPMGLILGGCIFALASYKKPDLFKTAQNCFYLAIIIIPFTALLGLMDWQYRFYGKWSGLITAKIILAAVISALIILTLYLSRKESIKKSLVLIFYILTALCAVAMGFIGGEILYG